MKRRALLGTMTAGLVAPMLCGKAFAQSSNGIKLVIPISCRRRRRCFRQKPVRRIVQKSRKGYLGSQQTGCRRKYWYFLPY